MAIKHVFFNLFVFFQKLMNTGHLDFHQLLHGSFWLKVTNNNCKTADSSCYSIFILLDKYFEE